VLPASTEEASAQVAMEGMCYSMEGATCAANSQPVGLMISRKHVYSVGIDSIC